MRLSEKKNVDKGSMDTKNPEELASGLVNSVLATLVEMTRIRRKGAYLVTRTVNILPFVRLRR